MDFAALWADLREHLWIYLLMPVIAAFVGYTTKMLALEMMFEPLEFKGIKPWLGWQGVVPRKAEKMAGTAADLLLGRLLEPSELFRRIDPDRMLKLLEQPLLQASEDLTRELGERYFPGMWSALPEFIRRRLIRRIQQELPTLARQLWNDVGRDVNQYFDARHLLVSNLIKDRALLNQIFKRVGRKEFVFFRNTGFFFGAAIGFVQLACWLQWHRHWLMPAFGASVGFLSDWLALQLLFRPLRPVHVFGLRIQGKFLSRQQEVSRDYAELIAKQLLTPAHIIEELLRGPMADRLVDLVQRHVKGMTDEQLGLARPFVAAALGSTRYMEMRDFVMQRVLDLLPAASREIERYASDALDLRRFIVARMEQLPPEEFESILRPPFKEDEKILIIAGGVLGFLVGEFQALLML